MDSKTRKFLRELCKRSLYHFVEIIINETIPKDIRLPLKPFHKEVLDFLQREDIKRKGALLPRYFLKSTIATQSMPIWLYINNHEVRVLIVNEVFGRAKDFLHFTKRQIEENRLLRYLYPEIAVDATWKDKHRWSSEEMDLPRKGIYKDPTFKCMGVGAAGQGYHGTHIFLDDIIGKAAMTSDVERLGTERWFNNVTELLANPDHSKANGSHIYILGTHWAPGDIYQKIRQERKEFEWYVLGAEDDYGNPTWPEKLSREEIARMKSNPDELIKFYTQMMNNPMKTDLADFKPAWIKDKEWKKVFTDDGEVAYSYRAPRYSEETGYELQDRFVLERELEITAVIDPAVSEGGIKRTSRTAIVIVGFDRNTGCKLVLEAWARRIGQPSELYNKVFEFHDRYHPLRWKIETYAQQMFIMKAIKEEARRRGVYIPLTELPKDVGQNAKEIRIRELRDDFSAGTVFLGNGQTELVAEYLAFPMGTTNDLIDALAWCKLFWREPEEDGDDDDFSYQDFLDGRSKVTGY